MLMPLRKSVLRVSASVRLLTHARPVLRVERRPITRQGGRSCKAMLNTSLPLEQLPHPQQLYGGGEGWGGGAGSAQVPAMSGQLPGFFWRAVSGGR